MKKFRQERAFFLSASEISSKVWRNMTVFKHKDLFRKGIINVWNESTYGREVYLFWM